MRVYYVLCVCMCVCVCVCVCVCASVVCACIIYLCCVCVCVSVCVGGCVCAYVWLCVCMRVYLYNHSDFFAHRPLSRSCSQLCCIYYVEAYIDAHALT